MVRSASRKGHKGHKGQYVTGGTVVVGVPQLPASPATKSHRRAGSPRSVRADDHATKQLRNSGCDS